MTMRCCHVCHDASLADVIPPQISIIKGVRHPNCLMFMGICLEPKPALVMEYCDRHSLFDCLGAARAGRYAGHTVGQHRG